MSTRFLRGFATLALVAGAAVVAAPTPAKAIAVNFSTTGAFGTTTTNSVTLNGITITFTGAPATGVNLGTPTNQPFGSFTTSGTLDGTTGPISDTFTLTIHQTVPSSGTASFPPAEVTGTITVNNDPNVGNTSMAYVQFQSPLTQTIGTLVNYTITSHDDDFAGRVELPAPGGGAASINGRITAAPEPATLASLVIGLSLLGLGARARGRRKLSS